MSKRYTFADVAQALGVSPGKAENLIREHKLHTVLATVSTGVGLSAKEVKKWTISEHDFRRLESAVTTSKVRLRPGDHLPQKDKKTGKGGKPLSNKPL